MGSKNELHMTRVRVTQQGRVIDFHQTMVNPKRKMDTMIKIV
jgi:hypothetical protein